MSLSNGVAIKRANITHAVTVLRIYINKDRFKVFGKHLHIPVDDDDLMQHFPATNQFIQSGLDGGGGVLVRWWGAFYLIYFLSWFRCVCEISCFLFKLVAAGRMSALNFSLSLTFGDIRIPKLGYVTYNPGIVMFP